MENKEKVLEQLENVNKKLDKMISIMEKPQNRLLKILEVSGTVATIFGGLAIIELFRNWIGG